MSPPRTIPRSAASRTWARPRSASRSRSPASPGCWRSPNGWGCSSRIAASRQPRYILTMNARPADRLNIALAQLNPTVGDVAGNADKVRRARATAAGAGRRSRASSPSCSLPAIRPRTSCSSPRSRPPAAPRSRRWRARPRAARRCWSARRGSRTASSTTPMLLLEGGAIDAAALQGRSAELRRVRREARVRARARCRGRS